jgi:hypothetical protein
MMTYLNRKRGQSTVEYAVLIIIIICALISIQAYIKRGVQGRLKSATDDIGDQFSPGNTNAIVSEKSHSQTRQEFGIGPADPADPKSAIVPKQGFARSYMIAPEETNTQSNSSIVNDQKEHWGG